ncbi:MAG: hypothetical protein RMX35_26195, partial [Nostoc sp. DcaGUA01]|nr:hypothetical protein [Nostoc sp. DcaGUA01]
NSIWFAFSHIAFSLNSSYLIEDKKSEGEPVYSLRLREPIGNRLYAEHLPMRVAQEVLADKELEQFKKI